MEILVVVGGAVVLFNVFVSHRLVRLLHDRQRLGAQLAFIWFVPLIGGLIALHLLNEEREAPFKENPYADRRDPDFGNGRLNRSRDSRREDEPDTEAD